MSETLPDPTLELLLKREHQFDLEVQRASLRLETVRELIADINSRKPRAPRKPRLMLPGAEPAPDAGPQPIAVAMEGALDRLGAAVRASDAARAISEFDELGTGAASDTHREAA